MEKTEDQKNIVKCRVCLDCNSDEEQSKCLSLFEEYNDCVISNKINALTNVGIEEGDGLPDRICPTCLLELESAFKFKLKCESSNEVLLSAVNNVPTQLEASDDVADPIKEEYLEDDIFEYAFEDNNNLLSEIPAAPEDPETRMDTPPRPSRATDLKLECHDCGGSFTSKCKLRVHWKKVHMTENIKCPDCFRKFKTYRALSSHKKRKLKSCAAASKVRIEGEGTNRVFYCRECNYHTLKSSCISVHILRHTGNLKDNNIVLNEIAAAPKDDTLENRGDTPPVPSRPIDLKLECHDCGSPFTSMLFRHNLAEALVAASQSSTPSTAVTATLIRSTTKVRPKLTGNHFIAKGRTKHSVCVWCRMHRKRKTRTVYICEQCGVSLCLEFCFKEYHS